MPGRDRFSIPDLLSREDEKKIKNAPFLRFPTDRMTARMPNRVSCPEIRDASKTKINWHLHRIAVSWKYLHLRCCMLPLLGREKKIRLFEMTTRDAATVGPTLKSIIQGFSPLYMVSREPFSLQPPAGHYPHKRDSRARILCMLGTSTPASTVCNPQCRRT